MTKKAFRITPYAHERLKFVVSSHVGGKRERKFFGTKKEADTYVHLKEVELLNHGKEGIAFSAVDRALAQRATEILKPFGKTVLDGAEFLAAHLRRISASRKVADVLEELITARKADGMSADYLSDLKIRLGAFSRAFDSTMIAGITAKDVSAWLRGLSVGAVSRNTVRSRLSTLFSFARKQGYIQTNPIPDVERAKERGGEVGILTVPETSRLLTKASVETIPYWTIGAFAGLRSAELERLDWKEIDFDAWLIEVKASKAKTATRRLVTILPNLQAWLLPYRNHEGPVCPIGLRKKLEADRERADLLENWPSNALRHSYGSYHLAQFKDAAALALQMGNSPAMIFRHYRELVRPAEAVKYWALSPSQ
jgi:integrase